MTQQQHEQECLITFGKSFAEVHRFLDQYSARIRGHNHRMLLHHKRGVELVLQKFGEEARARANSISSSTGIFYRILGSI